MIDRECREALSETLELLKLRNLDSKEWDKRIDAIRARIHEPTEAELTMAILNRTMSGGQTVAEACGFLDEPEPQKTADAKLCGQCGMVGQYKLQCTRRPIEAPKMDGTEYVR